MQTMWAESIFGTPGRMSVCLAVLFGSLLIAAAWRDVTHRKVPNQLVFAGALTALLLHVLLPQGNGFFSPLPGGLGGWKASAGIALGLVMMLPLHIWLGLGAGDVKLMAMVGAFLGPLQIWGALLLSILAGGLLALFLMLSLNDAEPQKLPYAVAIAIGSLASLGFQLSHP